MNPRCSLAYSTADLRCAIGDTFCFIYKCRARFGIIARTITERLDHDWESLCVCGKSVASCSMT